MLQKLIGWCFTVQIDNDPEHTVNETQEPLNAKKCNILQWPSQSPYLTRVEHTYHLLKTELRADKPTNEQQQKVAAVKA